MKNMDRVIFGSVLLIGLGFGLNAQACTTDGWQGGAVNATVGSPKGTPDVVKRYSEFCAMSATDNTSHVHSTFASDTRYIGRFYFYPRDASGAGEVDILVAYSEDTAENVLFTISYDGTDLHFDASGAGGGSASTAADTTHWNLIEFEFNSDGNFNFWVNETWDFAGQAYTTGPTDTFASGTGTVEAVRFGTPNGMAGQSGTFAFDAYESHRTTPVGALLSGDANGNGSITVADVTSILNELANTLQAGQPDCNETGGVTVADATCLINTL
jgi:hypothetical protein